MATFLDLVNKVIDESADELDQLTSVTWSLPDAGRRLYPRIKRLVAEAWRLMQIERGEWEFKTKEATTTINPRIKFQSGIRAAGSPAAGTIFVGQESGFKVTVSQVILTDGDWATGATGQIEFVAYEGQTILPGELFIEETPIPSDGVFEYTKKGSYDLSEVDPFYSEMHWDTMVGYVVGSTPVPMIYTPWDNWAYEEVSFVENHTAPPAYFSQDYEGNITFYPQTLTSFNINFVYALGPQELTNFDDVPEGLSPVYHEWIAWEALMNLAAYDKDPDLFAYASKMASKYRKRAERNLMPVVAWGRSRYDEPRYPR